MIIEIDNSKFELQREDTMRINKLTQLTDFKRILESKVDINLKIAKILTNALHWKIDFTALKGSKYSIIFPATKDAGLVVKASPKDGRFEESKSPNQDLVQQTHANNNIITVNALEDEDKEELSRNLDGSRN